MLSKEDVKPY